LSEDEDEENEVEVLQSGKTLKCEIRTDSSSGMKLIDPSLLNFLHEVLENPAENRTVLPKTVQVAIDCFVACVARVGEKSKIKSPKFIAHSEKGRRNLLLSSKLFSTMIYYFSIR